MSEKISDEELEKLFFKTKIELEDALFEKDMYKEKCRTLKYENHSLKDSIQFNKKHNETTFNTLCSKIFPNYWRIYPYSKGLYLHIIKDWEDGMLGMVVDGFGSKNIKCYMENEKYRRIDCSKKDWINML